MSRSEDRQQLQGEHRGTEEEDSVRNMPRSWSLASRVPQGWEQRCLEPEEALFLEYIEYIDFKNASGYTAASSYDQSGPPPGLADPSQRAAYMVRVKELNCVDRHEPISEDQCAPQQIQIQVAR